MSIDVRQRHHDGLEAVRAIVERHLADTWTSLPGTIESWDAAKGTAVVQPSIKVGVRQPDGSTKLTSLPLVGDVPMHQPSGGGVSVTFPHKKGDEVLLVFASRSVDVWHQQGGEQAQLNARMHSLSDAFAIPGFRSQPRALSNVSADSTQIRSDDGHHVIDLHPSKGLTLTSKGTSMAIGEDGVHITGPALTHNGVSISHDHVHTNVRKGGDLSGPPEG